MIGARRDVRPEQVLRPRAGDAVEADEVERTHDEALAAIAAAGDLDALKPARIAHAGDRSPLALANREIGALPPAARAEAGKRVGRPAAPSPRRSPPGRPSSRPSATSGCSSRRPSTSRCRGTARPRGARHPLTTIQERVADIFVAMGYEWPRAPRSRRSGSTSTR